eukprot:CAMPEP_0185621634 /NCGR_PEP_ID=MMETSP0436-20130131/58029_1 /TAXON_ID=626734 ORGANISM="Favella taraikaensis, Strain Fe Narragansett Bay" /NCGR_SAMPLE_ID=MMETSP0436 /ASSEMBLY_ACC=CAM_ASM_000390 /LENGTH=33 /DNA_ID= /DNA_START= /DNA_END= /DNA_ORIENTATION=
MGFVARSTLQVAQDVVALALLFAADIVTKRDVA